MIDRIGKLADDVMQGKVWFETTPTEYDRMDILLDPIEMSAKRTYEYILNQTPQITQYSALAGYIRFDGSVEGDVFNRMGHKNFSELMDNFYNQPVNNLITFEWQHSVGDFNRILKIGIKGIKELIAKSKEVNTEEKQIQFLNGIDVICDAMVDWAKKCSEFALKKAEETENPEYKKNLSKLAATLLKVPENPAETFYEALLSVYLCYSFIPDGLGLLDRYLYPYYKKDIENGVITKDEAKSYLQELFLMCQARISIKSDRFYRGGECHFCVGGYLPNGEDGFNDLSHLIVESLMELPSCIPQISLRWTKKTPHEVLRYMMDCERKDKNKRIAFVSDEPRIKAFTDIVGLSYEDAVSYCMVGCNEPALPGGRIMGFSQQNIARSIENTFTKRADDIAKAASFDDFYKIYEEELFSDMTEMLRIDEEFTMAAARDCNLVSSIFFRGCVESGKSVTQGGISLGTATMDIIGTTTAIDSLTVVKQFVYDEKRTTMENLTQALKNNWEGYEDLRNEIIKRGKFFGNDEEISNSLAQRFYDSIYRFLSDKTNHLGKKYLVGNLIGYNQHNAWFGEQMQATPDGRYAGEPISFGNGQNNGKDRNGISALLNSVAKSDPHCIMNGPSVTNVLLDEQLVLNDDNFEKLVTLFETYFQNGGLHFQPTYVSKEDLIAAKKTPDKYKSLRVRVSGFSDFFVNLNDDLQDEIITRTVIAG